MKKKKSNEEKMTQMTKVSLFEREKTADEGSRESVQTNGFWDVDEAGDLPSFPEGVYGQLPSVLKAVCALVSQGERDMVLLGSIAATSATMHNVSSEYGGDTIHPHIYALIEAAAGVGKGRMKLCNRLIERVNERRPLNVSADISGPRFVQRLGELGGVGFVFSTEVDLLATSLKGAHGKKMTSYLRLAFSHETIIHSTMTGGESTVPLPKLSLLITGTPGQVEKLFNEKDFENGLFTRFLICHREADTETRNNLKRPDSAQESMQTRMAQLSDFFLACWIRLQDEAQTYYVIPDEGCGHTLELWQEERKRESNERFGDNRMDGLINRYGEIVWRITMTLTMLKYSHARLAYSYAAQMAEQKINVSPADFQVALSLVDTLFWHAAFHFRKMTPGPEPEKIKKRDRMLQDAKFLLSQMPDKFTIGDYEEAGVRLLNVSPRTARRLFERFIADTLAERCDSKTWRRK